MNQEEGFQNQLSEERASDRMAEPKTKKPGIEKTGALRTALKFLKNPLAKPLITSLGEIGTGGILPGCTGYVVWTYIEEKKTGNPGNPNIAEYLTVGIPAVVVDVIGLLGLTGVLLIFSYAITVPCLGLLIFWGIHKHGLKSATASKKLKTKKT